VHLLFCYLGQILLACHGFLESSSKLVRAQDLMRVSQREVVMLMKHLRSLLSRLELLIQLLFHDDLF
jgi:hypothetical protein